MSQDNKNLGQQGNQNWDDQNDQRADNSRQPNPERFESEKTGQGQQSNQDWDDANDKRSNQPHQPNPERLEGGEGQQSAAGASFNEQSTTGAGSSQRSERENVGPLDADLSDLPSEKRNSRNQTGPGLG
jgi:hypothetical protein